MPSIRGLPTGEGKRVKGIIPLPAERKKFYNRYKKVGDYMDGRKNPSAKQLEALKKGREKRQRQLKRIRNKKKRDKADKK